VGFPLTGPASFGLARIRGMRYAMDRDYDPLFLCMTPTSPSPAYLPALVAEWGPNGLNARLAVTIPGGGNRELAACRQIQ